MITIKSSNPYEAYKQAISIALGGKGSIRPKMKERKLYGFVFQDDVEEYEYVFDDLNYKYVEELPVSDITVFSQEDFGRFFYEYGRVLLGNLMICLTKADWNTISLNSNQEAAYVTNYFRSLVTMDDHVEHVVEEFKKNLNDSEYGEFPLDILSASHIIRKYKDKVRDSRYSKDLCNCKIFYVAYIGLMFILYGLLLLFPNLGNKGMDVLSYLSSPKSRSSMELYSSILSEDYGDVDVKKRFITLIYTFYKTTNFYRMTSCLPDMDPMIGNLYDIAENFISKLDSEDDEASNSVKNLIDPEIGEYSDVGSGLSIQSFTDKYDPVLDILSFRNGGIIHNDNSNIWKLGKRYLKGYKFEIETTTVDRTTYKQITEVLKPVMQCYMAANMKDSYSNEEIEMAFRAVANIITAIDEDKMSTIDPGFILQLTVMAAAFRTLDARSTQRSKKAKEYINASIDILDILIVKLYDQWFKSGKYYKQENRPHYGKDDSCNETLSTLKKETDDIISNYLIFVRFGVETLESDKLLLKSINSERLLMHGSEHLNEFITSNFSCPDQNTFIRLCATKGGRSIVQTIYEKNSKFEFVNLVLAYARTALPEAYISSMGVAPEHHTGVSIIDRLIESAVEARGMATTNPEVYIIGIYGVIWTYLDSYMKKHNTGNYFDFGNANNSLDDYNVEHTVAKLVGSPLKSKIEFIGL